jgi:hypothetical protein
MSTDTLQTLADQYRFQVEALQKRNAYLENELKQAKQLFQDIVNDWEVHQEQEVKSNLLDTMFGNPMEQLNNLL